MQKRSSSTYILLERFRAGLGAAGTIAVLAEGISSSRVLTGVFGLSALSGILVDTIIGIISVTAFVVASYVVDIPSSSDKDADR